jgi:tetraprenyl-beta-curcumene synthase
VWAAFVSVRETFAAHTSSACSDPRNGHRRGDRDRTPGDRPRHGQGRRSGVLAGKRDAPHRLPHPCCLRQASPQPPNIKSVRETLALVRMLVRYRFTIAPIVRRELRHWERLAGHHPDPSLRAHALSKLHDERLNAEAAATFASLVHRRQRATATRLMVAFEVMYDYLDAVSEQPAPDTLLSGRQLHGALIAAVTPSVPSENYYRHQPTGDDGGYLATLVAVCRAHLQRLPSARTVAPVAHRAATRCGEAQTRTHAVASLGPSQPASWSEERAPVGYERWEYAARSTASLGVHALFAAAGDPDTTLADAERIDAAYHPAICALATLLDSVIDCDIDTPGNDHRYVAYYATTAIAAARIASIAQEALLRAHSLRDGALHGIIVAGGRVLLPLGARGRSALRSPGESRRLHSYWARDDSDRRPATTTTRRGHGIRSTCGTPSENGLGFVRFVRSSNGTRGSGACP